MLEVEYELPHHIVAEVGKEFVEQTFGRDMRHSIDNFKALVETKVLQPV